MNTVVTIDRIGAHVGAEVEVRGWLYNLRSSGALHFLLVRDGTGILQAVAVRADLPPEVFETAGAVSQESSIVVEGVVREDRRAPGGYEMTLRGLRVVQTAEPYPITPKEHGTEFLMDHRHLWLRSRRRQRLKTLSHQLPYLLDTLKAALEAGHVLLRGLQMAAQDNPDPLSDELHVIVDQVRVGLLHQFPAPYALSDVVVALPGHDDETHTL